MRILVTGSAGFIGFHLCRRLLAEGHEIVGLDGMTNYYDPALKRARHAALLTSNHFQAHEIMLEDDVALTRLVQDTRAGRFPGPTKAIAEFLLRQKDFESRGGAFVRDRRPEHFLISQHSGGFLRRLWPNERPGEFDEDK
jgi:hypothetical protein